MKSVLVFSILCFLVPTTLLAQVDRNMLVNTYSKDFVKSNLKPTGISSFFPPYAERQQWDAIDPVYKAQLIKEGEAELDYKWQIVPATTYLEFVKTGNRRVMEDVYDRNVAALKKLAFAELAEGKERFLPQIINGAWALCEITSWSISASIGLQKAGAGLPDVNEPVIELGVGITSNALAWTYYLFNKTFDKYSPLISKRIKQEIERRVLKPYAERNDFWWMALDGKKRMVNNWNVWINYNVLTCLLLVEDNASKRAEGVYKTMRSVDQFINYYKEDGGCEEGPAYWSHAGGMLYNYLAMLNQATQGNINLFDKPLIKNIGAYIYKAYIDSTYFLNYADASAKMVADAGLVYHYGKAINDSTLTGFGAYLAKQQQWNLAVPVETMYGGIRNVLSAHSMLETTPHKPMIGDTWMGGIEIAIGRDKEGSSKGFYFSALGGHNDESHNHNDVGTCVLFFNGEPLLIDIGNEVYTRQTFGPERYTIWTMRSAYHNVPLINGVEQQQGKQYAAQHTKFKATAAEVRFEADIAKAYPENAAVSKWIRSYQLKRNQSFTITDNYQLVANKGNTALHFMTPARVQKIKDGILQFIIGDAKVDLQYNSKALDYTMEAVDITDKRLLQSWPPVVYRLIFKLRNTSEVKGQHTLTFKESLK